MLVFRKPKSVDWYHNSAQCLDDIDVTVEPWTGALQISFDATKDKSGERHTTVKILLAEREVENWYDRLVQGRKNELRETQREVKKLNKKMEYTFDQIENHIVKLDEKWTHSTAESDEEAVWEKLKTPLEKLLEQRYVT